MKKITTLLLAFVLSLTALGSGVVITSRSASAAPSVNQLNNQLKAACGDYEKALKKANNTKKVKLSSDDKKPHSWCNNFKKISNKNQLKKNLKDTKDATGSINTKISKAGDGGKKDDKKDAEPSNTCGAAATYFDFGCGKDEDASKEGGKNNPIVKVLATLIKILTAGIGLVAIGGVVTGGVIYSTAAGNGETAKKGLSFIFNSVLGLALYAFLVAILNFAIPGGLFS